MSNQTRDTSPEVIEAVLSKFDLKKTGMEIAYFGEKRLKEYTAEVVTAYESATAPKWSDTPPGGDGKLIFAESGKKEELWLVEGKVYWHDGNFLWSGPIQTPEGE